MGQPSNPSRLLSATSLTTKNPSDLGSESKNIAISVNDRWLLILPNTVYDRHLIPSVEGRIENSIEGCRISYLGVAQSRWVVFSGFYRMTSND